MAVGNFFERTAFALGMNYRWHRGGLLAVLLLLTTQGVCTASMTRQVSAGYFAI